MMMAVLTEADLAKAPAAEPASPDVGTPVTPAQPAQAPAKAKSTTKKPK